MSAVLLDKVIITKSKGHRSAQNILYDIECRVVSDRQYIDKWPNRSNFEHLFRTLNIRIVNKNKSCPQKITVYNANTVKHQIIKKYLKFILKKVFL